MTDISLDLAGPLPHEVAIVGGSGQIARILTELLVADGVSVRAIVRSDKHSESLREIGAEPVLCDVEKASADEIADALGDADAVVFAAGAGPGSGVDRKFSMDRDGSIKSVEAALLSGAMRFVQISFIGAQEPTPEGQDEVFAAYWDAKREADENLRKAALDWTIVKPGGLTDEPATRKGTVSVASLERGGNTRRADVAEFIRLVLADSATVWRDLDVVEGEARLDQALHDAIAAAPKVR